jgi:outer membrane protein assembly factor BamB
MHFKLTPTLRRSAPPLSLFPVLAIFFLCHAVLPLMQLRANDWPEWRGEGRCGIWSETGTLEKFPSEGLKPVWRVPIGGGYSGPAVANGRVFVTDFTSKQGPRGTERLIALDEPTGKILWTREWAADYSGLSYAYGPRATPTVDADRLYVLGAKGTLLCLRVTTGEVLWQRDYVKDYKTEVPTWGMAGAPLVDGERLICLVGGQPDAKVVAFNKLTGKEIWRALNSESEPGYNPPLMIEFGGTRQLIIWHPMALTSLDPANGNILWQQPFRVQSGLTVATPVLSGDRLLVSSFYNGSRLFQLDPRRPASELLWQGSSNSEIDSDGLHALITTPVIDGNYIYGVCSYGQFRCLDARTGRRIWETLAVTGEHARWACAHIVRNGNRYFINNDRGELIIARVSPSGYQEISRTKVIKPTTPGAGRRELGAVNWSHPAYANRHIILRNDEEILRYSLEQK